MNATVALPASLPDAPPSEGGRSTFGDLLAAVNDAVRQRRVAKAAVTGSLLLVAAAAGLTYAPLLTAYATVFVLSAVANAVLFLPSGRGAVMIAAAMTLNPLAVAIVAGAGGALGELTGYAVGRSSRRVVKGEALPGWLSRYTEKHMGATLMALYIIPSPFMDAAGIVAGRIGYPVSRFIAYSLIGKIIQSVIFVYLVLWNIELFSPLVG